VCWFAALTSCRCRSSELDGLATLQTDPPYQAVQLAANVCRRACFDCSAVARHSQKKTGIDLQLTGTECAEPVIGSGGSKVTIF